MASSSRAPSDYEMVNYPQPHPSRAAAILKAHPEVKTLFGRNPATFLVIPLCMALQLGAAYLLRSAPWWALALVAATVGATVCHTLWVVIHEASHRLIFQGRFANLVAALLANVVHVVPSAISFVKFHLIHHRHMGEYDKDADMPGHGEARLAGQGPLGKALWLALFPVFQSTRVLRFSKNIGLVDGWTVANFLLQAAFVGAVLHWLGAVALGYLLLSTFFAVGLHPYGGRWIQEHIVVAHPQETYSYYGPANLVAMNVGYHNEHHDFAGIPWNRLPRLRAMAREYYDNLSWHRSWTALVLRFIFDPSLNLFSHMAHPLNIESKILPIPPPGVAVAAEAREAA